MLLKYFLFLSFYSFTLFKNNKLKYGEPKKLDSDSELTTDKTKELATDKTKESELATDQTKETELATDQTKESELATDQTKESELATDQTKESELATDQTKESATELVSVKEEQALPVELIKYNFLNIKIYSDLEFAQGLINYLISNSESHYKILNNKNICLITDNVEETWTNIIIFYDNLEISIKNDLLLKFKNSCDKKKLYEFNEFINFAIKSEVTEDEINIKFNNFINFIKLKKMVTNIFKININNKIIKPELINKSYRNFDTIYLKKADEIKLKSVLDKFYTKKELFNSLGLSNKLCILLHGEFGTGKSSTIQAIASKLKKDIYYLSFSNIIRTNEDLHNVFNYIVNNNGIIVTEDIDTIGKLVHKKEDDFDEFNPKSEIIKELTLEYFLNLLQGTITPDGLIFIATTNNLDRIDPVFYRDGRFDLKIHMSRCDHYQMNTIYNKLIKRNIPSNLLKKIPENKYTPTQFIFNIKDHISDTNISDATNTNTNIIDANILECFTKN
jgi:ATP-dependent 26S proteasome regulatory subunit